LLPEELCAALDLAVSTGQRRGDRVALRRDQLSDEGIVFERSNTGAGVLVFELLARPERFEDPTSWS
jgi:hypothetical protein